MTFKPRALFISHVPVFPIKGGDTIRISQSLRYLSEIYDVDVIYLTKSKENTPVSNYLPSVKKEKWFFAPKFIRILRIAKTLINNKPSAVNHFYSKELHRYITKVYDNYDLIFCGSPVTAQYVTGLEHRHKVLDMTDSLSMNYHNAYATSRGWRKFLYKIDYKRMLEYETFCKGHFHSIAYISQKDSNYIKINNQNVHIVGNEVISTINSQPKYSAGPYNLIFIGKMDYEPNIQATTFIAEKVMPLIKAKLPDLQFFIIGGYPTKKIKALEKYENVKVTGYVDSLEEWLSSPNIFVAPMLSGSGVQNKILQSLSHGLITLTTPIGNEGLEELGDVLEIIEPNPEEWAKTITDIFNSPEKYSIKTDNARLRIKEVFGPERIKKQFIKFIQN